MSDYEIYIEDNIIDFITELKCIESCESYEELKESYKEGNFIDYFKEQEKENNDFYKAQDYVVKQLEHQIVSYLKEVY